MKKMVKKTNKENDVVLRLKTELNILKEYIKKDVSLPIVASFGFIIALVWRDAIKATLNEFLSRTNFIEQVYLYEIFSAIVITVLIMAIMILVTEMSRSRKNKKITKEVEKAKREIIKYSKGKEEKKK